MPFDDDDNVVDSSALAGIDEEVYAALLEAEWSYAPKASEHYVADVDARDT